MKVNGVRCGDEWGQIMNEFVSQKGRKKTSQGSSQGSGSLGDSVFNSESDISVMVFQNKLNGSVLGSEYFYFMLDFESLGSVLAR
jgi:hypothetical protein